MRGSSSKLGLAPVALAWRIVWSIMSEMLAFAVARTRTRNELLGTMFLWDDRTAPLARRGSNGIGPSITTTRGWCIRFPFSWRNGPILVVLVMGIIVVFPEAREPAANTAVMSVAILVTNDLVTLVGDDTTDPRHGVHDGVLFGLLILADELPVTEPPFVLGSLLDQFEEQVNLGFLAQARAGRGLDALPDVIPIVLWH